MPTDKEIEKYIRALCRCLDIGAVRFLILRSDSKSEWASVACSTSTSFVVTVSNELLQQSGAFQRATLVHEILHTVFHPYQREAHAVLRRTKLSRGERSTRRSTLNQLEEELIDRIANSVSTYLPLPPWHDRID